MALNVKTTSTTTHTHTAVLNLLQFYASLTTCKFVFSFFQPRGRRFTPPTNTMLAHTHAHTHTHTHTHMDEIFRLHSASFMCVAVLLQSACRGCFVKPRFVQIDAKNTKDSGILHQQLQHDQTDHLETFARRVRRTSDRLPVPTCTTSVANLCAAI